MREFRVARAFSAASIARLFIPVVYLIPVCLVLSPVVGAGMESSIVFAASATAAITVTIAARLARHRKMAADTVVRLSSRGVEMQDTYGSRIRMAWQDIERIEVVECRSPSPRTIAGPDGVRVRTGARQCVGLTGWGEHEVPPHVPGWLWSHLTRRPVDPRTGLQALSIPLGVVDPSWECGPMGEHIREHRPELFPAGPDRLTSANL